MRSCTWPKRNKPQRRTSCARLSGFNKPSHANEEAFNFAVEEVSAAAHKLWASLHTHSPPRDREVEAEKARERSRARFG